jgi:hypothetical protein
MCPQRWRVIRMRTRADRPLPKPGLVDAAAGGAEPAGQRRSGTGGVPRPERFWSVHQRKLIRKKFTVPPDFECC